LFSQSIRGVALLFLGSDGSLTNLLSNSVDIAIVEQEGSIVNTTHKSRKEEIMIPYSRIVLIAWDKDIGARLKDIRSSQNISQRKLATLANGAVSYNTIIKWEQGRVDSVSREKLDVLLDNLQSDVRDLFPNVTVRNYLLL
jgi:DNA-binding transcriptional regulator YiaG